MVLNRERQRRWYDINYLESEKKVVCACVFSLFFSSFSSIVLLSISFYVDGRFREKKYFEYVEDEEMLSVLFVLVRSRGLSCIWAFFFACGWCVFDVPSFILFVVVWDQLFGMYCRTKIQ